MEKILESPLDSKEIKPINPKGSQPWIFTGRSDAEAEAPILWPPDAKSWLIGKDPDAGKDWGQEKKGMTEDEMVGWRHWLDGHEFEQTPRDSKGQGSLARCSPWGHKETRLKDLTTIKRTSRPQLSTGHNRCSGLVTVFLHTHTHTHTHTLLSCSNSDAYHSSHVLYTDVQIYI